MPGKDLKTRMDLLLEIDKLLDRYESEPIPIRVMDQGITEFYEEFGDCFDFRMDLDDGGTVFVVVHHSQIFLAWHFGPDGQFIDYVERNHAPQGISDYEWLAQVCAELQGA